MSTHHRDNLEAPITSQEALIQTKRLTQVLETRYVDDTLIPGMKTTCCLFFISFMICFIFLALGVYVILLYLDYPSDVIFSPISSAFLSFFSFFYFFNSFFLSFFSFLFFLTPLSYCLFLYSPLANYFIYQCYDTSYCRFMLLSSIF